jgi:tetratricopeptide (TPR) repeat protein
MKLLLKFTLIAIALRAADVPPVRSAGARFFDKAARGLTACTVDGDVSSTEQGWAAVRAAGSSHPGFLEGVYSASSLFVTLGRDLRADSTYAEAQALVEAPALQPIKLRLQYMRANQLIARAEYVRAEAVLRQAVAAENRGARKSALYVAFLQSLAFVREQEGDLEDAETLYLSTLNYPAPDLSGTIQPVFNSGKLPLPFVGEPRSSIAAFFTTHGRLQEAETVYREQLANPGLDRETRLGAMRQLADFLSFHGSKVEALAMHEQIMGASPSPVERYAYANLLVDAGHEADAKAILEADLKRSEIEHEKDSPEYREALNYLFENRRYAGDLAAAEKFARQSVRLAETSDAPERNGLASALFRLAEIRTAQGQVEEANAVQQRGIEVNRASSPPPPSVARFAEAEEMVRAGKHQEAVAVAREIAATSTGCAGADQFGFHHLAQSLAGNFNADAAEVASLGLVSSERLHSPDDPDLASDLVDWANFYRGILGQPDRARGLLSRAEAIVRACCGEGSARMESILQERGWLADATGGDAARIPYLVQLRDLRVSIYGLHSRQTADVEEDLAATRKKLGR